MTTKKLLTALTVATLAGALLLPGVSAAREGRFGPQEPPRAAERHDYRHHDYERGYRHYRYYRHHFDGRHAMHHHHWRQYRDVRAYDRHPYRDDVRLHIDYDVHL